jgi:PAS domain S-box-containing protein
VVLAVAAALLVRRPFMELAVDYRTALHTIEQRHAALVRSEADLEAQKEWFRVTLTSIRDGVIVTDQEKRVVFMNHESERLTGWKNVEALLKPLPSVFRIVDEKSRQPLGDPATRALEGKTASSPSGLAVLLSHSGEEWPVEESSSPIQDAKGKILGVVLVFRNATEKRKAQAALQSHSAELEKNVEERTTALRQSVTELETFSYTVSHDLRSPLRAMQGFAQAVLEDYGDKLDDQGKDYLQRIKKAAERLDRLIQDLLSYTRISRQTIRTHAVDTDKFLRELVENYPNLHPPAAEVVIDGSLPRVVANEATLTQIFSNLLGNAVKFVRPGVLPHIRVWGEDQGAKARIWIEDNGIGIDPADFDRIFQMFVQVHETQAFGGTGVGLSIVKKATESMHGRVGLVSTPMEGSRFWVELPKAA